MALDDQECLNLALNSRKTFKITTGQVAFCRPRTKFWQRAPRGQINSLLNRSAQVMSNFFVADGIKFIDHSLLGT